jgi:hypothetical protein
MSAAKLISRLQQVPWKRAQKLKLTVDLIIDYKTREKDEREAVPGVRAAARRVPALPRRADQEL